MEAVVDAAVAAGIFAIAVGLVAFYGLSGGVSYLNYSEDAMVRTEARAVLNAVKGLIARSPYELYRLNPAYSGSTSIAVEGWRVNFVVRVRFPQQVMVSQAGVVLSYPSEYITCPTQQGKIAVTRYSIGVQGLRLDPALVSIDKDGKLSFPTNTKVCSPGGVSEAPSEPISAFSLEMPAVVYTDGGAYYVIPPAYPEAVLAVLNGRYIEPARVNIPADAVYLSETTVMGSGLNLVVEVWAWAGGVE
jgi:hypothetical protein